MLDKEKGNMLYGDYVGTNMLYGDYIGTNMLYGDDIGAIFPYFLLTTSKRIDRPASAKHPKP